MGSLALNGGKWIVQDLRAGRRDRIWNEGSVPLENKSPRVLDNCPSSPWFFDPRFWVLTSADSRPVQLCLCRGSTVSPITERAEKGTQWTVPSPQHLILNRDKHPHYFAHLSCRIHKVLLSGKPCSHATTSQEHPRVNKHACAYACICLWETELTLRCHFLRHRPLCLTNSILNWPGAHQSY